MAAEEALRRDFYTLLAALLRAAPDRDLLARVAALGGDDSTLGRAVGAVAAAARETTPQAVADEYHDLFIGLGCGELIPYGSYYQTGFLNERPLAQLRIDMGRLGIARADDVREPEDHIAAVMEMMAGLIDGAFGAPASLAVQHRFFDDHIAPWAPRFFEDLEGAGAARFYAPVGALGRRFLDIESQAFAMAA